MPIELLPASVPEALDTRDTNAQDAVEHYGADDYVFSLSETTHDTWYDPITKTQKFNRRIMRLRFFTKDQSGKVLPVDIDIGSGDDYSKCGAFTIHGADYDATRDGWKPSMTAGQLFDIADARRASTDPEFDAIQDAYDEESYREMMARRAEEGRAMRKHASVFGPGITVIRS